MKSSRKIQCISTLLIPRLCLVSILLLLLQRWDIMSTLSSSHSLPRTLRVSMRPEPSSILSNNPCKSSSTSHDIPFISSTISCRLPHLITTTQLSTSPSPHAFFPSVSPREQTTCATSLLFEETKEETAKTHHSSSPYSVSSTSSLLSPLQLGTGSKLRYAAKEVSPLLPLTGQGQANSCMTGAALLM